MEAAVKPATIVDLVSINKSAELRQFDAIDAD